MNDPAARAYRDEAMTPSPRQPIPLSVLPAEPTPVGR
jgi:hypothetical protein